VDDFANTYPELKPVLYNDVKVCGKCGKPCAFTMTTCNSCCASLEDVPITKSENVFSSFLFGVKRSVKGFPYTISLRRQTSDVLIFDDMLALTPCHMNAISAKYYIPDWRFLLTSPRLALELLDQMEAECWEATLPFLQDPVFRKTVIQGDVSDAEIRSKVIRSFNFPPSQFQMHIQWLVPPLLPFQHYMAEIRNHFHEGRAFPLDYVRAVLALNDPYTVEKNTPIEDIVAYYNSKGVSYSEYWASFYEKCLKDSLDLANWNAADFQYVVDDGKCYEFGVVDNEVVLGAVAEGVTPADCTGRDKTIFQNYGRPYVGGKTTGTFIKAPLQPTIGSGGYTEWPGLNLKSMM